MARGWIENQLPQGSRGVVSFMFNTSSIHKSTKSWGQDIFGNPLGGCTTVDNTKNGVLAGDIVPQGVCPTYNAYVTAYNTVVVKGCNSCDTTCSCIDHPGVSFDNNCDTQAHC